VATEPGSVSLGCNSQRGAEGDTEENHGDAVVEEAFGLDDQLEPPVRPQSLEDVVASMLGSVAVTMRKQPWRSCYDAF
jgi:hypothetical protein